MKKIFTFLALVFFLALPSFSVEFGAIIKDSTDFKFSGEDFKTKSLDQRETFTPSLKADLGKGANLSVEASVQHKLKSDLDGNNENFAIIDLDLFKFDKTAKFNDGKSFYFSLGRFNLGDATGVIFTQSSDGLFLKYGSTKIEVSAYGGYTGLLNIKNNSILKSDGAEFTLSDEKKIYDCAAPYAVATLNITAPYLFKKQTLAFEALGFFPVGGISELPDGEKSRLFATILLKGPMTQALFYSASATVETTFENVAFLAKFDMKYYFGKKDATLGFSTAYASGENGGLSAFSGFTKITSCLSAEELTFSGVFKFGFSASLKPVKNLLISMGLDPVFRAKEDFGYYGFQGAVALKYQIFSDLQFNVTGSIFAGKDKATNRAELAMGLAIAL